MFECEVFQYYKATKTKIVAGKKDSVCYFKMYVLALGFTPYRSLHFFSFFFYVNPSVIKSELF